MMRWILDEHFELCGFFHLPFAVRNNETKRLFFCNREEFELLFYCSGKKDIVSEQLTEHQQNYFQMLVNEKVIHEAKDGETRDLSYREYPNIFKQSVQWSVTGSCNYRCHHCFQSAAHGVLGSPSLETCLDIVRQLDECGIHEVAVTGGEPLVRPDLFEIFDEIKRRGMILTTIYSNGKLITQEFLNRLKAIGLQPAFQISFDGVGFHDWMRGVPGAEKAALDAFRLLKDNGFSASSAMCLCRENLSYIRETVKTLASVGCTSLKFQRTMPQGEWKSEPDHFLSYDETLNAYLDYLPLYKEDGCPIDIQMEGFFAFRKDYGWSIPCRRGAKNEKALEILPPCGIIHSSIYIGPNGAVVPCMSMCGSAVEKLFPNLSNQSLSEILTDSSYTKLTGKRAAYVLNHTEECVTCNRRLDCCSGCRAFATGDNTEDYFAPDLITCKILKEGWDNKAETLANELFPKFIQKASLEQSGC